MHGVVRFTDAPAEVEGVAPQLLDSAAGTGGCDEVGCAVTAAQSDSTAAAESRPRSTRCGDMEVSEIDSAITLKSSERLSVTKVASMEAEVEELPTATRMDRFKLTNERIHRDARHHWRRMLRGRRRHSTVSKEAAKPAGFITTMVASRTYELLSVCLIVSNAVFIGWQVQRATLNQGPSAELRVMEVVFTVAFSLDLLVRMIPEGCSFFSKAGEGVWNSFDFVVVMMILFEMALDFGLRHGSPSTATFPQFSMLRILRVIRIVRIIRVIRVFKFFRELRMMISSILQSFKSLTWAMLVLAMILYIFGIVFTQASAYHQENLDTWDSEETEELLRRFGKLERSALSLFEAMSGGISWGELLVSLAPVGVQYELLFLIYIAFSLFAVVNIVTGVFVESAMQCSQEDRESLIQEEMMSKEAYMVSMQKVFEEMDVDNSGSVSMTEFKAAIEDERLVAYFDALGLEITDVKTLFVLLDRDKTGLISIEDFVLGCMRLKGGAKSLDLAKLMYESEWIVHNMENMADTMRRLQLSYGVTPTPSRRSKGDASSSRSRPPSGRSSNSSRLTGSEHDANRRLTPPSARMLWN